MTTGAAQTLWRTARRLPGKRVMIAGNGPLNLQLAAELARGGAEIIGLAEAAPPIGATSSGRLAAMAFLSPRLVFNGAGYQATLRRKGIKRFNRALAASVRPSDTALLVTLAFPSLNRPPLELETDILCLGYGFEPSNEILRALGCEHDVGATGQLRARRDEWCRTSLDGVYALGDCTGLGGARLALAEGTLAGLDAAARLGHGTASQVAAAARRQVERHRRFQHHLWKLYSCQPDWLTLAKPDTLICRCEDVSLGDLSASIGSGIVALPALKQRSRVGMGPCQGRYCRPLIEEIIRRETGQAPTQFSGFAPRMPLKPIAVGELARTGGSLDGE
jgi:NADPH-dependent 2,4-dienoyl-CoA reductase/sulfur reductase-like enzyme